MSAKNFELELLKMQGHLFNFAYMLTTNHDDAHDLVQDTTLKALDNRERYVDNVNFRGWVFTIMRNQFINNYRKHIRLAEVASSQVDEYHLQVSAVDRDTPENTFTAEEITQAIDALPDELSRPFSMYVSGYKYQEIADHLKVPVGTVKSRIFYTRQRLQRQFA